MDPFVRLQGLPFVVCSECKFACIAGEVRTHLARHHDDRTVNERRAIEANVRAIPGIIYTQAELRKFQIPERVPEPIPYIQAPMQDGIACEACPYICRRRRHIQEHCRVVHDWQNTRRRGRIYDGSERKGSVGPWRTNVHCQRLFPSRAASGWFEVEKPAVKAEVPESSDNDDEWYEWLMEFDQTQEKKLQEQMKQEMIEELDPKLEANAWLKRAGWTTHLGGLDRSTLRPTRIPAGEDEPVLAEIEESMNRIMEAARIVCQPEKVGFSSLFEINRREVEKKPKEPFNARMEADSWIRYKQAWQQIMAIMYRTRNMKEEDRPPYEMTAAQSAGWDTLVDMAQRRVQDGQEEPGSPEDWRRSAETSTDSSSSSKSGSDSDSDSDSSGHRARRQSVARETPTTAEMDAQCLALVMLFLDHPLDGPEYESAIISALAVLGIREDGGWVDVMDYTPILSGMIKVARMLAISHVCQQRQREIHAAMDRQGIREKAARVHVVGIFPRVRKVVRRFMTRVNKSGSPSPMDWILELRTYGMHIRFNTTAGGAIDWTGERVRYKKVGFSMAQLTEMMHTLLREAQGLMAELAMVDGEIAALPSVPWNEVEDDNSEEQVGYSFLEDKRNTWLQKGHGWITKRMVEDEEVRRRWIQTTKVAGENGTQRRHNFRTREIGAYARKLQRFRERLWLLMHFTSGQPARATEIMGIRHRNTANGGARNVFISNGQMCFVTAYHKNFQQTNEAKIIHRFMPREVGTLVVWYLWLVLPFWQKVQGMVRGEVRPSPFLWAEDVAGRRVRVGEPGGESGNEIDEQVEIKREESEDDDGLAENDKRQRTMIFTEKVWTSDRGRRIIQQHSERLMACKVNIAIWRQVAIAISNRYLGTKYTRGKDDEAAFEDEDGIDDEASDLQAGHGSHVAGMIYARELQQGLGGTAMMREKFREVSQRWHRFFGFDIGISARWRAGQKRPKEEFETTREDMQIRRLHALQQTNMHGALRQMVGDGAQFRGQQEAVIRDIVQGKTPIVQVAATGGGKSMSFMLPAFCSPDGVTIVIVPLVALQQDMQTRCEQSGITSHVWSSKRHNPITSIVFVTPESACTGMFQEYVTRLQSRGVLDRVVVDECHVILDGNAKFRPRLRDIGSITKSWGVQRVFLTATLRPTEMDRFFTLACVQPGRAIIHRSRTTRCNIRYRVITIKAEQPEQQEEAEDGEVCRLAQEWLATHEEGKVIIYAGRVTRVEKIGAALGCSAYHNKVDTAEGKRQRLEQWVQSERLVVATNALGLGIDVPNVRLVIHAWMPMRMRDYAQESGRAGRDGQSSEAVVVCGGLRVETEAEMQHQRQKGGRQDRAGRRERETAVYTQPGQCRRVVLDEAMDGRADRGHCEEGEEACDVCMRHGIGTWERQDEDTIQPASEDRQEPWGKARSMVVGQARQQMMEQWQEQETAQHEAEQGEVRHGVGGRDEQESVQSKVASEGEKDGFEDARSVVVTQQRRQAVAQLQEQEKARQDAEQAEELEALLIAWGSCCAVCHMVEDGDDHAVADCPYKDGDGYARIEKTVAMLDKEMFTKRRLEDFSGCFGCGVPQRICGQWEAVEGDEGRYKKRKGGRCQHKGVVTRVLATALEVLGERAVAEAIGWRGEQNHAFFEWMGQRVGRWGGFETNEMCRAFVRVSTSVMAE